MYSGIHNFSEIGKLNKVLLHRPGEELESLTPATLERLLFDDIPYLKVAQEEHDRFAEVLRENGVEVIYYVDEVAKAIADPARQIQLVNDFLNISKIHAKGLRASMTSLLLDMPPKQMVTKMIAGIKRCEVATKQPTTTIRSSPTPCRTCTSPATPAPAWARASTSTACIPLRANARVCS